MDASTAEVGPWRRYHGEPSAGVLRPAALRRLRRHARRPRETRRRARRAVRRGMAKHAARRSRSTRPCSATSVTRARGATRARRPTSGARRTATRCSRGFRTSTARALSKADRENYDIFRLEQENAREAFPSDSHYFALNQREGIQTANEVADTVDFQSESGLPRLASATFGLSGAGRSNHRSLARSGGEKARPPAGGDGSRHRAARPSDRRRSREIPVFQAISRDGELVSPRAAGEPSRPRRSAR